MSPHVNAQHKGPAMANKAQALLGVLALSLLPNLAAAQLAPVAKKEVEALLNAVGSCGCEFVRGGTAHPAAKAQQHLQKKYEYLAARDKMSKTEDFIVMAAARSSVTGEPYSIRCAGVAPQNSEDWLRAKLVELRAASR